ncbi:dephospho-CoA kinase [bacterium]|nr:dephospho-CoA kinase [bacterium]
MILGLTGAIGSGKSTVSAMLAECGAVIICADRIAHEVVAPGSEALGEIAEAFGSHVIHPDGSLDRQALAAIVFPDPSQRRRLEGIVHPRVRRVVLNLLSQHVDDPLVVLDVPLLFESAYESRCDHTVSVTVSEEVRRERLLRDRGMTQEQVEARLSAQLSQDEKNRRATFLVDNSGTLHQTCLQVAKLLDRLFPGNLPTPLVRPTCEGPLPNKTQ